MEFMQLKMFVLTAEEHSVTRAGRRVFRTQSAVSLAISKLEDEIGHVLFERRERNDYVLTVAGQLLHGYAVRLLALHEEALGALRKHAHPTGASETR